MEKARIEQIALQGVEPNKLDLLRSISKKINQKTEKPKPKKNCKYCYGRGFVGYLNGVKSIPVPCRCVYRRKVNV